MRLSFAHLVRRMVVNLFVAAALMSGSAAWAKQSRDAQLQEPPRTKYPALAELLGIEGHCDVYFAVDERGLPFAVEPRCTHPIFCFDAKRAVSGTKFKPQLIDGVPSVRTRLIFPIIYAMEGSDYSTTDDGGPLNDCEKKAVA